MSEELFKTLLAAAADEIERLRALLKEVRDECLFDDHDLFARVCDALEGVSGE